jgi:hypothetical protein
MAIESVGGSVVSKIAELLVEPAIRQFRYMFCFNNFVQEFNEQKKNLALTMMSELLKGMLKKFTKMSVNGWKMQTTKLKV